MSEDLKLPPIPEAPKKPWTLTHSSYRTPSSYYVGLTAETLAAYKAEFVAYEAKRQAFIAARVEILKRAVAMLTDAGFPAQRNWSEMGRGVTRKYKSETLSAALSPFLESGAWASCYTNDEEAWLREASSREREAKEKADAAGKRDRAVTFLLAQGKVYGTDFTADTAISVATDRVFEAQKFVAEKNAEPMSFSGDDMCEGCVGWTPGDHRCACGNRRVSWSCDGDFENLTIYPEAY